MNENPERPNRPGKPLEQWKLYSLKLGPENTPQGVTTPDGKFYNFENGEQFEQIQIEEVPGARVSVVVEVDGTRKLFEDWAAERK